MAMPNKKLWKLSILQKSQFFVVFNSEVKSWSPRLAMHKLPSAQLTTPLLASAHLQSAIVTITHNLHRCMLATTLEWVCPLSVLLCSCRCCLLCCTAAKQSHCHYCYHHSCHWLIICSLFLFFVCVLVSAAAVAAFEKNFAVTIVAILPVLLPLLLSLLLPLSHCCIADAIAIAVCCHHSHFHHSKSQLIDVSFKLQLLCPWQCCSHWLLLPSLHCGGCCSTMSSNPCSCFKDCHCCHNC